MSESGNVLREGIGLFVGEVVLLVSLLIGVLEPGIVGLFLYARDLFIELDVVKLLLLSIVITLPSLTLSLIGILIIMYASTRNDPNDIDYIEKRKEALVYALVVNSIIFNIPLVEKIFDDSKNIYFFAQFVIVTSFITLISFLIIALLVAIEKR